ncbi:MAG: ATP-binding protein [Bryobacteraceae bacterium]|jgi:two-component system sensor histidine kinase KdpD
MRRLVWHLAISVSLIGVILAVCTRVPRVHSATVALIMVLAIVGLAKMWGWLESLIGALIGGIGFDHYFLPPHGLGISTFEHWLDLIAFLVTAIATSQLVARSKRQRIEAEERKSVMEKLFRLVNALLYSGSTESTAARLADHVLEIFEADGVAIYDKHTGQIVRSGPGAAAISDQALHQAATNGPRLADAHPAFSLAPIGHGGELVGSIGISGARLPESLLSELAGRVGLGLARLYAIETTTEAEVVRRSEELKSAVLDAMAHEIRNPLNSVKLAATTLLSGHAGSESQQREMLTIIDQEANRMDRYIDEAVHLARLEANVLSLQKEAHDIAQLIPAALEELGAATAGRPIQVSVPESLPFAECDQRMVLWVLKQLLNNALKYSPGGSPLTVSAECTGAAIVIDVVDRGRGVAEAERDRIFEKYYRGRAARSRTPGTGLGLSSARSIVRAHGGEIWVTAPPGGGAAFHVSLPIASAGRAVGTT